MDQIFNLMDISLQNLCHLSEWKLYDFCHIQMSSQPLSLLWTSLISPAGVTSLKWLCGQATCFIFASTRWRILVRWCAVENLHFGCGVSVISVASISRCISVSTGMPQKVRIVRFGSLLVFYPYIAIIKGGLCGWMLFRSGSSQGAPASVASISRVGVILSFLIVTYISISDWSHYSHHAWFDASIVNHRHVCCSIRHGRSPQTHHPGHQNAFPATFGSLPCGQSCQKLFLIGVEAWASWPFSAPIGLDPDPYEGILDAEWKWSDLPSFPVISCPCQQDYLHVIPHGRLKAASTITTGS